MCIDMCFDMCLDMCLDMDLDMCLDMCIDLCLDMCLDMEFDMSPDTYVSRRVMLTIGGWRSALMTVMVAALQQRRYDGLQQGYYRSCGTDTCVSTCI